MGHAAICVACEVGEYMIIPLGQHLEFHCKHCHTQISIEIKE